ncbi:MAG: 5'-methylthioadenosine/adenosylhomocysteine nucleosidase [Runella slithyformis]|nr:MAG: 5'-methylthioadenosine/adenosylhomocysteine nucleosidase [Runella sp.]TAG22688.1 MAG: 5'-methylthioadenosine/adenosylhomocysteine nucleosidase [Cytophagales bacterium]TAG41844.1 MAG: 5'-methylthioadenosine/adenosylhomocysteine nucleosidase [Cytophagia bacterium]TAG75126.1 MAG: 5'-methylthioadenosine/adenosylhomocysteine nucleosidase [Runella slithyformis]TAG83511.1 MAG: 5'-methylthioadenosine/adenosylhomocysteine nucleosidase [Cytophagales bacterium]
MRLKSTVYLLLCVFICASAQAQLYKPRPVTALLGAFDEEIKLLRQELKNPKEHLIHGIRFYSGKIAGKRVVIAGTGIGKVNAAMTTSLLLRQFKPKRVLFTGIAGGLRADLQPGDIVLAKSTLQHDFGAVGNNLFTIWETRNPVLKQKNPLYFKADSLLLVMAENAAQQTQFQQLTTQGRLPQISTGVVATGDQFISSETKVLQLMADFGADAVEMEGGAVAQVCWQQQVPCLIIRSISDKADSNANETMINFTTTAAYNSANLLISFLGKLLD